MDYAKWLDEFTKGKKQVAEFTQSDTFAVHSIRRFMDEKHHLWEIALTYTSKLVVRSGVIQSDGITVKWENWETRHDVDIRRLEK